MDTLNSYLNEPILIIKQQLIDNLTENIKEIQFEFRENGSQPLKLCDCTNTLCTIIESIFLHGLKDNFLQKTYKNFLKRNSIHTASIHTNVSTTVGKINEFDVQIKRNEKNFWPTLLLTTHKTIIKTIEANKLLINDIGHCRSWLRLTITDSLLTSHLKLLYKNNKLLYPYYNKNAYLRDYDKLDITIKLIDIIENYVLIELPYSSSLLNQWSNETLLMSGILSPDAIRSTITSGVDVANTLFCDDTIDDLCQNVLTSCISNIDNNNDINVLSSKNDNKPSTSFDISVLNLAVPTYTEPEPTTSALLTHCNNDSINNYNHMKIGNSINSQTSWSTILTNDKLQTSDLLAITPNICKSNILSDNQSYNTLLDKHNNINDNQYQRILNYNDLWKLFENNLIKEKGTPRMVDNQKSSPLTTDDSNIIIYDNIKLFNKIETIEIHQIFTINQLHDMIEQLFKLSHERGMDKQNYNCFNCGSPLGIGGFITAKVCTFNGYYNCDDCMLPEMTIIPSRIIINWDFKRYPISHKSFKFLNIFMNKPLINLKQLNPHIYEASELMKLIQRKRRQLYYLRNYLYTCCQLIIEKFNALFNNKYYLYDNIDMYAMDDFLLIEKGSFVCLLDDGIKYGRDHVHGCQLCSQKGFICEICNEIKVLYPFDIDETYLCTVCFTVYHNGCWDLFKSCPKCKRKKKREDLPLLDVCNIDYN